MTEVFRVPDAAAIRDEPTELVFNDLHGPAAGESEEFTERPTSRYTLGLAPNGAVVKPAESDRMADADADVESGEEEPEAPNIASLHPSSYGFTVHVDGAVDKLFVHASWEALRAYARRRRRRARVAVSRWVGASRSL